MWKVKRVLAFFISCSMVFALAACGGAEGDGTQSGGSDTALTGEGEDWLPFGLQFGQSYDAFVETVESQGLEAPALEPADSNNGYLTDNLSLSNIAAESYLDYGVYIAATGDNTMENRWDGFAFSFNPDKELYEWYWSTTPSARSTDDVIQAMISTYNEKFGFDGAVNDGSDVRAAWETESLAANIRLGQLSDGSDMVTLIFHSFAYDLNS